MLGTELKIQQEGGGLAILNWFRIEIFSELLMSSLRHERVCLLDNKRRTEYIIDLNHSLSKFISFFHVIYRHKFSRITGLMKIDKMHD